MLQGAMCRMEQVRSLQRNDCKIRKGDAAKHKPPAEETQKKER